ncbi:MAG: carbon storage regulator [Pirellulales bacterium]
MLILSRKIGERIQVGEHVCITVVRIGNGGVRLGVEAPDGYAVARSELSSQQGRQNTATDLETADDKRQATS